MAANLRTQQLSNALIGRVSGLLAWKRLCLRLGLLRKATRCAVRRESRAHGQGRLRRLRLRVGLRIIGRIVFVVFRGGPCHPWGHLVRVSRAENELARHSLALIADHDNVVAGTLQKLCEHVPRGRWAKFSEDSLILGKALHS